MNRLIRHFPILLFLAALCIATIAYAQDTEAIDIDGVIQSIDAVVGLVLPEHAATIGGILRAAAQVAGSIAFLLVAVKPLVRKWKPEDEWPQWLRVLMRVLDKSAFNTFPADRLAEHLQTKKALALTQDKLQALRDASDTVQTPPWNRPFGGSK